MSNGCTYGKGTRWALAILTTVLLTLAGLGLHQAIAAREDVAHAANQLDTRLRGHTEDISTNREAMGRIEERLNGIDASLKRIERTLER